MVNTIRSIIDEKGFFNLHVENKILEDLKMSKYELHQIVEKLKSEGYVVLAGRTSYVNDEGRYKTIKYLCSPGTEHKKIFEYYRNELEDFIKKSMKSRITGGEQ